MVQLGLVTGIIRVTALSSHPVVCDVPPGGVTRVVCPIDVLTPLALEMVGDLDDSQHDTDDIAIRPLAYIDDVISGPD